MPEELGSSGTRTSENSWPPRANVGTVRRAIVARLHHTWCRSAPCCESATWLAGVLELVTLSLAPQRGAADAEEPRRLGHVAPAARQHALDVQRRGGLALAAQAACRCEG